MRLSACLIFLTALQISRSTCQMTHSAFSCAIGAKKLPPKDENLATRLYKVFNPSGYRLVENYVLFYLYTRDNPDGEEIILGDSTNLENSSYNAERPTKIITHGYLGNKNRQACVLPRDAFLKSGDYNVIVVDWWGMQSIWGAVPLDYWTVSGYVGEVGSYVATMINFLENHGMNPETTALIGHSLGAHVMGVAGHNANRKVNYIVALDPALPGFENSAPGDRISIEDAEIVEVIHTNNNECGMPNQIGHYDFYPNGGSKQPGCISNVCSHSRSYELYAESIYNEAGFYGRKCDGLESAVSGTCFGDVAIMGGGSKRDKAPYGIYHLRTKESSPYALGLEQ